MQDNFRGALGKRARLERARAPPAAKAEDLVCFTGIIAFFGQAM